MNNDQMITKLPPQDIAKLFNIHVSKREAALAAMLAKLEPRTTKEVESEPAFKPIRKAPLKVAGASVEPVQAIPARPSRWRATDAPSDENRAVFAVIPIEWGNGWHLPCASLQVGLGRK